MPFTPHSIKRFQQRLGWHPNRKTTKDIEKMIRDKNYTFIRKGSNRNTDVLAVMYKSYRLNIVWNYKRKKIITLWREDD